jgi:carboxymethylenebutenolidase
MTNKRMTPLAVVLCILTGLSLLLSAAARADEDPLVMPEPVKFPSRDGRTELTGYVFKPLPPGRIKSVISMVSPNEHAGKSEPGRFPGVVMLHGRGGPYSSAAKGRYDETTLSQRHLMWGRFWADRGYVAVLVDSFGPRGYPQGFPPNSYNERPGEVNEQTVRPQDAYGALDYMRGRQDVIANRIAVQGWSNGGMTVLSALDLDRYADVASSQAGGFRAAIAMYPGCRGQVQTYYRPYAALLLLIAGADEEVSAAICERMAAEVRDRTRYLTSVKFDGAAHAYDDPAPSRQAVPANRTATEDSKKRAEAFFKEWMQR